jgi:hypothetical protein
VDPLELIMGILCFCPFLVIYTCQDYIRRRYGRKR